MPASKGLAGDNTRISERRGLRFCLPSFALHHTSPCRCHRHCCVMSWAMGMGLVKALEQVMVNNHCDAAPLDQPTDLYWYRSSSVWHHTSQWLVQVLVLDTE